MWKPHLHHDNHTLSLVGLMTTVQRQKGEKSPGRSVDPGFRFPRMLRAIPLLVGVRIDWLTSSFGCQRVPRVMIHILLIELYATVR